MLGLRLGLRLGCDKDNIKEDSPTSTCHGIYKKGACPSHIELLSVKNMKHKREMEMKKCDVKVVHETKYIRETNRSWYERGREQMRKIRQMEKNSQLLKHYIQYHKNFNMKN